MEIGYYSMNLSCDNDYPYAADDPHKLYEFPKTYTGHTRSECQKQARLDGWTFHRDGKVSCPKCKRVR